MDHLYESMRGLEFGSIFLASTKFLLFRRETSFSLAVGNKTETFVWSEIVIHYESEREKGTAQHSKKKGTLHQSLLTF